MKRRSRAEVVTGKFRLGGLGRAIAVAETGGFVKWIADAKTDQLLGAAVVGAHATELIAEAALAIRSELTAPISPHRPRASDVRRVVDGGRARVTWHVRSRATEAEQIGCSRE